MMGEQSLFLFHPPDVFLHPEYQLLPLSLLKEEGAGESLIHETAPPPPEPHAQAADVNYGA